MSDLHKFFKLLKYSGLPAQQKRTLRGQAVCGDLEGAKKGYERLMRAKEKAKKGVS